MRIKNFTLLTLALFVMSVVAFAQKPNSTQRVLTPKQQILQAQRTGQLTKENASAFKFAKPALPQNMKKAKANKQVLPVTKKAPGKGALGQKIDYAVSPRMMNQQALRSARRAASDYPIITEAPEGETKTYKRAGDCTYVSNGSAYLGTQSGKMEVVFAANNEVYMKNPVCGYDTEAYVKGTLSADGSTITVPLGQNLMYSSDYDAAVATSMLIYNEEGLSKDTETTEITYTIDGETITLNGTDESHWLSCFWTDDNSWTGYSEWNTVLTEYVPIPVVTPPAGLVTEDWTIARYFYDGDSEAGEERVLKVGFDGDDVYVQGFGYYMEEAWIKGTLSADGKSITFASGQYYGALESNGNTYDIYFVVYDLYTGDFSPVTVDYDAEAGTMTWPESALVLENGAEDEMSMYGYFTEIAAMVKGTAPDPLPAPDIVTDEWLFKSQLLSTDQDTGETVVSDYNLHVQVGVGGNEVFIKGLCEDLPDAWIKGTLDPETNKVTFPTGQHFGTYLYWFWEFDYYFAGYGMNGMEDVVMNYDAEAKTLTMESPYYMLVNAAWLLLNPNLIMTDVQLQVIPDVAATPAQPNIIKAALTGTSYPNVTVDIPTSDVDGNPILAGKLSYQYYYDVNKVVTPLTLTPDLYTSLSEDMTEIPYSFTDDWDIFNYMLYLNMDFSSWNKMGIQSIYRGGGEEHKSEISWFTFVPYPHEVTFVAANDLSIQNDKATVTVNGKKETVDADGKLNVPETYTVTIKAAKGYRFVSASSTGATVTVADDLFSATFEMPTEDVTINYELREMGGEILFTTTGEYTIQDGQATVLLAGEDVTGNVDANGLLIDNAKDATVTINAIPGFKLTSATASYTAKGGANELTVFDGTATNGYVPVNGLWADSYLKSETVMPASELAAINGKNISAMSFYLASPAAAAWTSTFRVFLKEVAATTLDSFTGEEDATVVYEGTLDATGETMDIDFTTPYNYKGGNLLIGVYGVIPGNYKSAYFLGTTAVGASVQGYSSSSLDDVPAKAQNFIPKTTFSCSDSSASIDLDVNLAADGTTASFVMPDGNVTVAYEIERLGYPIEVPADAYITYYTDKDILIYDADCQLLTVTGLSANEATVTPLNVVAANTPMLISNSAKADKVLWIVPTEETPDKPAADEVTVVPEFKGTLTGQTFTDADMNGKEYYVCTGYSFAWVRGAGSIGANKCWLEFETDATTNASNLAIVYADGGTTGINTVSGKMETEGQYYDLNGRKLNAAPTQKGVYIINGKKAVIK